MVLAMAHDSLMQPGSFAATFSKVNPCGLGQVQRTRTIRPELRRSCAMFDQLS
jgi:hypothetical protein